MKTVEDAASALTSPDPVTRKVAVDRIVELRPPDAFDLVLPMLSDPVPRVRGAAAFNLGELGDERAVAHLLRMARSDTSEVARAEAFGALGAFRHPEIPQLLIDEIMRPKQSRMPVEESARQLRHYDAEEARAPLSRVLLQDEDAWARELAAESLLVHNAPSLVDVWSAALDDDNPEVQRIAREALDWLGVGPARPE